ncbi:hypothetical protein V491_06021 [Pseudogymnoascus sp. VKM F-3775]|nr:hypothetical protein V491_06021 [Pseudogymnoascus sp. VKM F-3775]
MAATSTAGTAVSRASWRHQQTRGIRLEFWSWNVQPGSRGHQASHKISKSAYIEALNRKLLRNRQHRLHISNSSMKSFMCSAFLENKSRVNLQELKNDATRIASNIARATSGSINTSRKATTDRHSARTPTNDGTLLNQKYDIDPITNRKVFKQESSTSSTQADSPAGHLPIENFYDQGPPVSQFPGPQPLPKQSTTTTRDGASASTSQSKGTYVTDSELYRDGRTVEQELGVYTPFQHNEPDGHFPPPPDPVEQALSNGRPLEEELGIYKPFRYNEPDGHFPPPPDPVEQALSNGRPLEEELGIYKPFRYNEPDGHFTPPPDPVEQALTNGRPLEEELGIYKPFRYNEPDGHFPPPPDPVEQALNNGRTLKEELGVYKPFRHNEPDGHPPVSADSAGGTLRNRRQLADELVVYKPFLYNEPDGKYAPPPNPVDKSLNEFDKKWDPELKTRTTSRHNEIDGYIPPPPNPADQALNESNKKSDPELDAYTAFRHNEPDGHFPPPPNPVEQGLNEFDRKWDPELDAYVPFRHNEPDGHFAPPADPVERALNEFDQKWDPELDAYVPFRHNEPDGHFPPPADPVNKALNEFDQKWEPKLENDNFFFDEDFDPERSAGLVSNNAKQASSGKQGKESSSTIIKRSRKESKKEKQARRRKMEEDFDASSTQFSKDIEAVAKSDKIRAARERAQEFEIERSELLNHQGHLRGKVDARLREIAELDRREAGAIPVPESSKDPLERDQAGSSANNDGEPGPFVFVSSYGTDLPAAAKAVQGSKGKKVNAKGIKEDKLKETLVNELRNIYQDTYGAIEPQHRQPVGQFSAKAASENQSAENGSGTGAQRPTLYKILAYSPDTKTVLTTETTSIVPPGKRIPLSPASVLPRLSKPAMFLPHIAPLLNEGYEIASGDGHVLVFRKVRDGPPLGSPAAKADSDRKMTNPIDGMQSIRPATGNFASPTGFVNHDLPEYSFKPTADHDERTYGRSESSWKDRGFHDRAARRQKGKKKVKRLLIGAAWVGGLSYAVGVVAEFFRTGGADGKGAVGL